MVDVCFIKNGVAKFAGHRFVAWRHGLDWIPPRIAVTDQDGHTVGRACWVYINRAEPMILRAVHADQTPKLKAIAAVRNKRVTGGAIFSRQLVHIWVCAHDVRGRVVMGLSPLSVVFDVRPQPFLPRKDMPERK